VTDATCSVEGCARPVTARGMCKRCYYRALNKGEFQPNAPRTVCSVEDCGAKHYGRGLCRAHWKKQRRYGDPLFVTGRKKAGDPWPECSVDGCAAPAKSRGYCKQCYARWLKHGDPTAGGAPRPQGEVLSYNGVHRRLREIRGKASEYNCVDCGGQAAEWSFCHDAEMQLVDPHGLPYSPDLDDYQARCARCHWAYDRNRGSTPLHGESSVA
jgi:hypothetical protein